MAPPHKNGSLGRANRPGEPVPRGNSHAPRVSSGGIVLPLENPTRRGIPLWLLVFLFLIPGRLLPAAPPAAPAPFQNFRDRQLGVEGHPKAPPPPATLKEIRIGWFGPSTSDHPAWGSRWWSAQRAIAEANARGGFQGAPFQLKPRWSDTPWGNGAALVTQLAYTDQVWAILGSVDGATTHLAEQVVAKARLPLISPVASDTSINLAGVPWMFSCAPGDHQVAPLLVQMVMSSLPSPDSSFILLNGTDHDSRSMLTEFKKALNQSGRMPAFQFEFDPVNPGLDLILGPLKTHSPSVIVLIAAPEPAARLVRTLRPHTPSAVWIGSQSLAHNHFIERAGAESEGIRVPRLCIPSSNDPAGLEFSRDFKTRFAREPDDPARLTYDATRLLITAIRHGGPDRVALQQTLHSMPPWQGISGAFQFDGTGQNNALLLAPGIIRKGRIAAEE